MAAQDDVTLDWNQHMKQMVFNWLVGDTKCRLRENFLMLLGNPYLFQRDTFLQQLNDIEKARVFYNATWNQAKISFCEPLFGAPMTAMYLEVLAQLGVRNIVACGYAGGVSPSAEIGSYAAPCSACGLDGTTRAYSPYSWTFPASEVMIKALHRELDRRGARYETGPIASIDALVLEDDAMMRDLRAGGFSFIDLETASLYALGQIRNINSCALHIVTDNPTRKTIDRTKRHKSSFAGQVEIALSVLKMLSE